MGVHCLQHGGSAVLHCNGICCVKVSRKNGISEKGVPLFNFCFKFRICRNCNGVGNIRRRKHGAFRLSYVHFTAQSVYLFNRNCVACAERTRQIFNEKFCQSDFCFNFYRSNSRFIADSEIQACHNNNQFNRRLYVSDCNDSDRFCNRRLQLCKSFRQMADLCCCRNPPCVSANGFGACVKAF